MDARVTFALRATALAALAVGLHGCVVVDARRELIIDPPGTLYGADRVRLRVNGSCDTVAVELDGKALPETYPANREIFVPLAVANGRHRLVVRAREGALAGAAAERTLEVDHGPFEIASIDPPPGVVRASGNFTVRVSFTNHIDAGFEPPRGGPGSVISVVSADRRSVTVTWPASLGELGSASLSLELQAAGDVVARDYPVGEWRAPAFTVSVTEPQGWTRAVGPLRFAATAQGELPDAAELVAGDRVLATLGAPPWDVAFDPRVLPDGTHRLGIRAPGFHVSGDFPELYLDQTPPSVASCAPATSPPDQAGVAECVVIAFTEPVSGAFDEARLVAGAAERPTSVRADGLYPASRLTLCPTASLPAGSLPVDETVVLPPIEDASGNALAPFTCTVRLRAWSAPYGTGALSAGLLAGEVGFDACGSGPATLLAIPPAGARGAGTVERWDAGADGAWSRSAVVSAEAGSAAAGLGAGVWVERVSGVGHVHVCMDPARTLNADTGRDARRPSMDPDPGGPVVAWSEADPAGGRSIRVKVRAPPDGRWLDQGSPARAAATSVADAPAVVSYTHAPDGYVRDIVAWIETAPGGVPQLRGAITDLAGGWSPLSDVTSRDPSADAREVAAAEIGSDVVLTWSEGSQVLAAVRHAGTSVAPEVLNVSSSATARLPHLDASVSEPVVYWVESTSAGDEIWARRWNGSAWDLLPGPVNDGLEGAVVRDLDVSLYAVVWTDDAGIVRLRKRGF